MDSHEALSFPLTFILKIIMEAEAVPGGNREKIDAVFRDLGLSAEDRGRKESGAGRFTSYSVSVTVEDRPQFLLLHEKIAAVPGVRYVL